MLDIDRAMMVAEKAHSNQSYDIYPYTYHIKKVLDVYNSVLSEIDYGENLMTQKNVQIRIACILHDVIEDSDVTYNEIKLHFGERVANIVHSVTDGEGKNRKERKDVMYRKLVGNQDAIIVKLCDRIANLEHSKKYNQKLYKMYKKEHEEFKHKVLGGYERVDIMGVTNKLYSKYLSLMEK